MGLGSDGFDLGFGDLGIGFVQGIWSFFFDFATCLGIGDVLSGLDCTYFFFFFPGRALSGRDGVVRRATAQALHWCGTG